MTADTDNGDEVVDVETDLNCESLTDTVPLSGAAASSRNIGGKKRPFDLMESADSTGVDRTALIEVSLYNLIYLDGTTTDRKNLVSDGFAVMKFWHDRKKQFPSLHAVAARIYATPVSSAASERVFSVLKLVVDERRSRMSTSLIDDTIVIRSLYE